MRSPLSTAVGIVTDRVRASEAYRLGREDVVRAAVEAIGPSPTVARLKDFGGITEVVRSQIARASTPGLDDNLGSPMFPLTPRSLLASEASSLRLSVQQLLSANHATAHTRKKSAAQLEAEIASAIARGQSHLDKPKHGGGTAKAGRYGYENGQRVAVLDYIGNEIGTGRVRSGGNYPESNEYVTWVTMTRAGETATEEHPTRRVIYRS